MRKLIMFILLAMTLSSCENLNASYNGNHINGNYSESGVNANISIKRNSSTAQ